MIPTFGYGDTEAIPASFGYGEPGGEVVLPPVVGQADATVTLYQSGVGMVAVYQVMTAEVERV